MKTIILTVALATLWDATTAQNKYQTPFENSPANKIEIMAGSGKMVIVGHDKNEIVIESDYVKTDAPKPAPAPPEASRNPDRAKGLTPLTAESGGNTDIGLTVDKSGNTFSVLNIANDAADNAYTFYIPNKVKLEVVEMRPVNRTSYNLQNLNGEINVTSINSSVKIADVTGPVVAQTTNGSIEIIYGKFAPGKPNSLTSVNGFVDVSLPADTKIDLTISAINGKAYTDFDIAPIDEQSSVAAPFPAFEIFNLDGKVNGGGAPFTISAVNGDVYLRKKK